MTSARHLERALLLGAGISADPPASLPLGGEFDLILRRTCYDAAERMAPDAVDRRGFAAVCARRCNALARLAKCAGSPMVFKLLDAFRVAVPNEAHFLAAVHVEHRTLLLTLNFDDGIERAHALLAGTADLPAGTPPQFHSTLREWRRLVRPQSPLRVVTPQTANDERYDQPLLVKLRGSASHGWDPSLVPAGPWDDPDPRRMRPDQLAFVRAAAAARHLAVAGVSGADRDCRTTLLPLLRPGRFSWTAAPLDAGLIADLRRIDPRQPVLQPAIEGLRSGLPNAADLPRWPCADLASDHFAHRVERWRGALGDEVAAQGYAQLLHEAGLHDQATALHRALSAHRVRGGPTVSRADQSPGIPPVGICVV